MRKIFVISVCFMASAVFCQVLLADQSKENLAVRAAQAWLVLVDAGNYQASWQQAASYFKNAVDKDQWERSMIAYRQPLGNALSRKIIAKKYTQSLPGAPDGEYVVIQYRSAFENKASAVETVTPMLDTDGNWRVSGYYIK